MKRPLNTSTVLMVLWLLAAASAHGARAALWKTEAELTAQYGEPAEISRDIFTRDIDSRTFTYKVDDLKLSVQFQDGVSQMIRYAHEDETKPFSFEEIESLLQANSDGKTWHSKDKDIWELGSPPVARASIDGMQITSLSADGKETSSHSFEVETVVFEQKETVKAMAPYQDRSYTGAETRFQGVLEFKNEEDDNRVAIIRDGKTVIEIPLGWRNSLEKLEAGQAYEIVLIDQEIVNHAWGAFVSDRVHKSLNDRINDSEFLPLVRIKHAGEVVYDESVCEVHKTPMQRTKAEVDYGMYGPASKADAVCDKEYPHHADWIRRGCVEGDVQTAFHYVCRECVAATVKYKREHPDEGPAPR